jgi:hypothetical protein
MFARSMIRTIALVAAVSALPATALAAGPEGAQRPGQSAEEHGKGPRGGKGEREAHQFPMKGADFITMVDAKIQKVRAKVQEKLAKHPLPDATRKQVMAEVDAGAAKVKAAAQKAAADGTVTKDEAKEVRDLAHQVKKDARAKAGLPERGKGHGKDKDGRGKGKGKGGGKA